MITAEQRYHNAVRKSSLLAIRAVRRFTAGEIEFIEGDYDRKCMIGALRLAYEAGQRDASHSPHRRES